MSQVTIIRFLYYKIVGGLAGSIDKECVHNTVHSLSIDPVGLPTN